MNNRLLAKLVLQEGKAPSVRGLSAEENPVLKKGKPLVIRGLHVKHFSLSAKVFFTNGIIAYHITGHTAHDDFSIF